MSFLNELQAINHNIPWPVAVAMVNDFNHLRDHLLGGDQNITPDTLLSYETFDAMDIRQVLDQPGCVGFRVYSGAGIDSRICCIMVGVDGNGHDVIMDNGANPLVLCMEEGQRFP